MGPGDQRLLGATLDDMRGWRVVPIYEGIDTC
jgi:hypothetical protein